MWAYSGSPLLFIIQKTNKNNSSVVEYHESDNRRYGIVERFPCHSQHFYAVIKSFRQKESVTKVFVDSAAVQFYEQQRGIQMVEPSAITIVLVKEIISKCIYMDINNNIYIGRLPNHLKLD